MITLTETQLCTDTNLLLCTSELNCDIMLLIVGIKQSCLRK